MWAVLVRTANARNTAIVGLHRSLRITDYGLRTTDYGLLAVRSSWEVLYSLYIEGQEPVEDEEAEQSSHSPLLPIYLLLYATTGRTCKQPDMWCANARFSATGERHC
jgi:hypothetical protein